MTISSRSAVLAFGWFELETKVHEVRFVQTEAGKTGKGIVHYWEASRDKAGKGWTRSCGQYRAFDIEDVISIR